jgi:hypothetical protein
VQFRPQSRSRTTWKLVYSFSDLGVFAPTARLRVKSPSQKPSTCSLTILPHYDPKMNELASLSAPPVNFLTALCLKSRNRRSSACGQLVPPGPSQSPQGSIASNNLNWKEKRNQATNGHFEVETSTNFIKFHFYPTLHPTSIFLRMLCQYES